MANHVHDDVPARRWPKLQFMSRHGGGAKRRSVGWFEEVGKLSIVPLLLPQASWQRLLRVLQDFPFSLLI